MNRIIIQVTDKRKINNNYDYCILEEDGTLSFYSEEGRCGGCYLSRKHYKSYGKTYAIAVSKHLKYLKQAKKEYYKKIMLALRSNSVEFVNLYYENLDKKQEPKSFIVKVGKTITKIKKYKQKIEFAIKVIERLRYEIHDLEWKKHIDEAVKELKK